MTRKNDLSRGFQFGDELLFISSHKPRWPLRAFLLGLVGCTTAINFETNGVLDWLKARPS